MVVCDWSSDVCSSDLALLETELLSLYHPRSHILCAPQHRRAISRRRVQRHGRTDRLRHRAERPRNAEEQREQLHRAYDACVASGKAKAALVPSSDFGSNVDMYRDTSRRPTFDVQTLHLRDGRLTVDTLLDRVAFGETIVALLPASCSR